jgi:hypothetical protein
MSARPLRLTRRDLEALRAFARAYLHEDLAAEYGSAAAAAAAFARDADATDARRVARALEALADDAQGRPDAVVARFFEREIRSAWVPEGAADLRALASAMRDAAQT